MTIKLNTEGRDWLRRHRACADGYRWASESCATLDDVWAMARPDWLIWVATRPGCLDDKTLRLFAVWCARQVQHLMTDHRSIAALDVAERYANGEATREELDAALSAAGSASDAAWSAARSAALSSALSAAGSAALSAAGSAAWSAADAAWSAADAAGSAARSAAGSAARSAAGSAALSAAGSAALSAQASYLREIARPNWA